MGILVKIQEGKPVRQNYTVQDVLTAITNTAGPKPDRKKSQIDFVIDQLRHIEVSTIADAEAVSQSVRILLDISRDIVEIGNFLKRA